jgi:hypothetical protein
METALSLDDTKIEHILAVLGALVPLASALASFLNHMVRQKQAEGKDVHPALLATGSFLNVASVNLDKAVQLAKMVRGKGAPAELPAPELPVAAEKPVDAPAATQGPLCEKCAAPPPVVCAKCGQPLKPAETAAPTTEAPANQ